MLMCDFCIQMIRLDGQGVHRTSLMMELSCAQTWDIGSGKESMNNRIEGSVFRRVFIK